MNCKKRWDSWAWTNSPFTRKFKTTQHFNCVKASSSILFYYRVAACVLLWVQLLIDTYMGCYYFKKVCFEFQYFTIWGQHMSTYTYTLLVLAYLYAPRDEDENSVNLLMWWKWCAYLWTMSLWWNVVITIGFWLFFYPFSAFSD